MSKTDRIKFVQFATRVTFNVGIKQGSNINNLSAASKGSFQKFKKHDKSKCKMSWKIYIFSLEGPGL